MTVQPFLIGEGWVEVLDGDPSGLAIYERHYSARKALARRRERRTKLYVGPGDKMVLLYADARALFVWRRERPEFRRDGQLGVNCAVFRNEGAGVASELILAAERPAWRRWPGERLFTFVDPAEVAGNPPGNVFLRAGWRRAGETALGLHILEKRP
jgi:hypothetical protein